MKINCIKSYNKQNSANSIKIQAHKSKATQKKKTNCNNPSVASTIVNNNIYISIEVGKECNFENNTNIDLKLFREYSDNEIVNGSRSIKSPKSFKCPKSALQ
jgi:hypothetical protein